MRSPCAAARVKAVHGGVKLDQLIRRFDEHMTDRRFKAKVEKRFTEEKDVWI